MKKLLLSAAFIAAAIGTAQVNPWDTAASTANDALNTANAARSLSEQVNYKVGTSVRQGEFGETIVGAGATFGF